MRRHVFEKLVTKQGETLRRCKRCGVERMSVATMSPQVTPVRGLLLYRAAGGANWSTCFYECSGGGT